MTQERRALVLGGTGTVGRQVVRALARAGVPTRFTFHRAETAARDLAREHGASCAALDLRDLSSVGAFMRALDPPPDVLIHCAAVINDTPWEDEPDAQTEALLRVNALSLLAATRALAPAMRAAGRGDVVAVGALDRAQALPLPPSFAASQGTLSAMAMALAKELGGAGVRVNVVALGLLEAGLSSRLPARLREDYLRFSALGRLGTAAEAAEAIVWLALHNSYMNGKILPVNGGI